MQSRTLPAGRSAVPSSGFSTVADGQPGERGQGEKENREEPEEDIMGQKKRAVKRGERRTEVKEVK